MCHILKWRHKICLTTESWKGLKALVTTVSDIEHDVKFRRSVR